MKENRKYGVVVAFEWQADFLPGITKSHQCPVAHEYCILEPQPSHDGGLPHHIRQKFPCQNKIILMHRRCRSAVPAMRTPTRWYSKRLRLWSITPARRQRGHQQHSGDQSGRSQRWTGRHAMLSTCCCRYLACIGCRTTWETLWRTVGAVFSVA